MAVGDAPGEHGGLSPERGCPLAPDVSHFRQATSSKPQFLLKIGHEVPTQLFREVVERPKLDNTEVLRGLSSRIKGAVRPPLSQRLCRIPSSPPSPAISLSPL